MYDFRNLNKVQNDEDVFLPTESMFFMDNDLPLESIIEGYQTVQVTGRELATPETNIQEKEFFNGGTYVNRRMPTREIKIKYLLAAKDSTEFRYSFRLLNQQLFTREVFKFYFKDEPEYYWIGAVSAVEEFPAGRNQGFSTFTITCVDPFKYPKNPYQITGEHEFTIDEDIPYLTAPERILIHYMEETSSTYIRDDMGHEITIKGTFAPPDEIEIIPNDPLKNFVYFHGNPAPERLYYMSQLKSFQVKKGSKLLLSDKATVTLTVGAKQL